jgi:hypothetical protein
MTHKGHVLIQNFNDPVTIAQIKLNRVKRTQEIVNEVLRVFEMDRTRKRVNLYRRVTLFNWLHNEKKYTLLAAGQIVCLQKPFDHATVIHGIKLLKDLLYIKDKLFADIYTETMDLINTLENE